MLSNDIRPVFQNIVLASDFLATNLEEQKSNLRWIKDLFYHPVLRGTEGKSRVSVLNWDVGFNFSRETFFLKSSMDVGEEYRQIYFDDNDILDESIAYVKEILQDVDVVIGYELSEGTREVLTRSGITYIDIWLHPVRFLSDLLFAFRSNDPEINNVLRCYEFPEEQCYIEASLLRIQNYRGFAKFKNDLRPNSALFIGQTLQDKAVASPEGMLTVLNFRRKFRDICREHSHVYYSRHPHVKTGDEECLAFVQGTGNVSLCSSPTYQLLASDEVELVFTVSSSVATEARFFSKKSVFFHKPPVPVFSGENGYTSVFHSFLFANFWESLLKKDAALTKPALELRLVNPKDRIRDTLSWYWGYRQIEKVETLRANVGKIFKNLKM